MENLNQIILELDQDNKRLVSNHIHFDDKGTFLIAKGIIEKDMPQERIYLDIFIRKEQIKPMKLEKKMDWPILAVIAFCFAVWLLLILNLFL